jgi:hypothetical protein
MVFACSMLLAFEKHDSTRLKHGQCLSENSRLFRSLTDVFSGILYPMSMHVYEVAGGWQAEDDKLAMACFGRDAEEARGALEIARERARSIAERWATMARADDELSAEDLADIAAAQDEIARGEYRRVTPRG